MARFIEVPHTGDICIRVWAPDVASFFEQCAVGLSHLLQTDGILGNPIHKMVSIRSDDLESLLIEFLSTLIFWVEVEKIVCSQIHLTYSNGLIDGVLLCHRYRALSRHIKAVTYHDLSIRETADGYTADIVFDL